MTSIAGWANPWDRGRHYEIQMACGHVERRWMKPSTAREVAGRRGGLRSEEKCASCRYPVLGRPVGEEVSDGR